jgi:hypothetical protein
MGRGTFGRLFEVLRNIGSAWLEVDLRLTLIPIVQILNRWVGPNLFSLSLLRVFLVKTSELEEAFLGTIQICAVAIHIGEWDWIEGGNPRPGLRSKDLRINILLKGTKTPPQGSTEKGLRGNHAGSTRTQCRKMSIGNYWEVQGGGTAIGVGEYSGEYEGFTKYYIRSRIK